jgi:hypothetical protein
LGLPGSSRLRSPKAVRPGCLLRKPGVDPRSGFRPGSGSEQEHGRPRSVGSKQLKKNAVTTAKIKNEAVTAAKIKNGTITGSQINLGLLGTVPSAANAANANTVGGLAPSSLIRSAYGTNSTGVTVGGSGTGTTVISARASRLRPACIRSGSRPITMAAARSLCEADR